ncbi:MAG: SDR family oxidoreductase [Patescibacteria group bacterium]
MNNKFALVTGASSGIGKDMCLELASRGYNLIVVARSKDKLDSIKNELTEKFNIQVHVITCDLSLLNSSQELYDQVKKLNIEVGLLINNAGYGIHKFFTDTSWPEQEAMLNLLIINLTHLTTLFAKNMVKNNSGKILLTSSIGAFQPTPSYATYAAAKSYVYNFGTALNYELKDSDVSCSVLCPGYTISGFQQAAGQKNITLFTRLTQMTSRKVAKIAIKGLLNNKPIIIPGFMNSFNSKLMSLLPNQLSAKLSLWALGKPE